MTPDKYRRGAIAASIRYVCADSPLGRMLIAATDRGICSIQFAKKDGELMEGLKREFPFAVRKLDEGGLQSWVERPAAPHARRGSTFFIAAGYSRDRISAPRVDLSAVDPLWSTKSYSEVAKAIGNPRACRAVARACATNPVAVVIPCHRVVREDGSDGRISLGDRAEEGVTRDGTRIVEKLDRHTVAGRVWN